jgi:hypothetical protein
LLSQDKEALSKHGRFLQSHVLNTSEELFVLEHEMLDLAGLYILEANNVSCDSQLESWLMGALLRMLYNPTILEREK